MIAKKKQISKKPKFLSLNKIIRIFIIVFVCFGSFNLVRHTYTGHGGEKVDLILLLVGLLCAGILLATDTIKKTKTKKTHLDIKIIDYGVIVLWAAAFLSVINEYKINHFIHEFLDLKRNLLVFEIVNWFIILIFLAAIGMLAASLLMFDRSRDRSYQKRWVISIACSVFLILALTIPIETVRVGSCGGLKETRLGLLRGGKKQIEEVKQQLKEQNQKIQQRKRSLSPDNHVIAEDVLGCSSGPVYVLYLL